jgi:hypothetical protein
LLATFHVFVVQPVQLVMRSISEFIQRIYDNPELAKAVTYHATHRDNAHNLCDFQDGAVYKEVLDTDPRFAGPSGAHNLMMGLITDGVQPAKDDAKYSMWPLAATFDNFPPWLRYMMGVTTLLGVIPGSTLPNSTLDLQPTLEIIMDQMELLDKVGVEVFDRHADLQRVVYAKLVQVGLVHTSGCCSPVAAGWFGAYELALQSGGSSARCWLASSASNSTRSKPCYLPLWQENDVGAMFV